MTVSQINHKKTALITGASSGIGEAFARRLAADGYKLILVARRADRLQLLADELNTVCGAPVLALAADLASENDLERIAEEIHSKGEVDILVNNAGFGLAGDFVEIGIDEHLMMMQVHMNASVYLAHACLPAMISRKSGGIINVSSVSAFLPWGNITYHSTKSFLVEFTRALHEELSGTGVKVQALCPGFTTTEFHNSDELSPVRRMALPKFLWHTPGDVVNESLISLERNKVICIPGLAYRLIVWVGSSPLTRSLFKKVAKWVRKTAR